jgi:hypothetical protein
MIDITNVDMVKFVQKVYDLSRPQGMGMLHFVAGPMSEEDARSLIQPDGTVSMDYVSGRACKMHTRLQGDRIVINDSWYDHSDEQFNELLEHLGLGKDVPAGSSAPEHGPSCNCDDCRHKRGLKDLDPQQDFVKAKRAIEDGTAFKIEGFKNIEDVKTFKP